MVASQAQRHAALLMLTDDDSPILRIAREITAVCEDLGLEAFVVGGVAVFLHGYERTTIDVDVYCMDRAAVGSALRDHGYVWDEVNRQFEKHGVPVQLLAPEDDLGFDPTRHELRDGIRVVSVADLVSMKLASGTRYVNRSRDLVDVEQLAEARVIGKSDTPRIAKAFRKEFKTLLKRLQQGPRREL